jgi:hypothetical protein
VTAGTLADRIGSHIQGEQEANRLLDQIERAHPDPDALYRTLWQAAAAGDPARFRGACRALQKALEAAL